MLAKRLLMAAGLQAQLPDYSLPNNDAASAFTNPNGSYPLLWGATYGYYCNHATWGAKAADINVPDMAQVRQVTATCTGYYNSPAGCLGQNLIKCSYSDSSVIYLGTFDGNSSAGGGQGIYSNEGAYSVVAADMVNQTVTATTPVGETLVSIEFFSCYYPGYPAAVRGFKDMIIGY